MKIYATGIDYRNNTAFLQKTADSVKNSKNENRDSRLLIGGLCAIGFGAVVYGCAKSSNKSTESVVKSVLGEITEKDKNFYESIIKSLRKSNIIVKMEDLKSIIAPDEFNKLIRKFQPEHFRVGKQISEAGMKDMSAEEFYKNAVDGNFRVSLHTHSNFSDGKATVDEFLECARKYADKVAKLNKNDDLPPFTIALTDHDTVEGCVEIIKKIVQDPEKYKNLKFVSGCEFSVKDGDKHYDITGLALNPFEYNLKKSLMDLSVSRKKVVRDFLEKQPEFNGKKITIDDLAEYEKVYYAKKGKGTKHSIENGNGIVSVRHAIKFFYKMTNQDVNNEVVNTLGDKEISQINDVIGMIKENGGLASLTHPLKSFWSYVGDGELLRLKNMGVQGIEVNHQYTPSKITKLGKINNNIDNADNLYNELFNKYKTFAEQNDMFLSGGTDSHEHQIFSRQPQITEEFLNNKLLK